MTFGCRTWLTATGCMLLMPALVLSAPKKPIAKGSAKPDPNATTVEMFAAMKSGDINVELFPRNAEEARIVVTNNTKKPLRIEMPGAFAGVPVLAQFAGGGVGGGGFGGNNNSGGGNQGMGGGMGMGMMGGGMMGGGGMGGMGGGGFFNIAPEKVAQVKVGLLCLEHGKKDPRPGIPYEIKPIDALTSNPAVHELLRQFANDKYPQRAAQAAAWHLNNNMSWQELAAKTIPHLNRPAESYFSRAELEGAVRVAHDASVRAEKNAKPSSASTSSATTKLQ